MAPKSTQVALVSGSNTGIGREVAVSLARDHGYHVIIASRQLPAGEAVAAELRAAGHKATAVQLDVTSDASIDAAVAAIDSQFGGRLDVLVNNAGVLLDATEFTNFPPQPSTRVLFDRTFQANVIGAACLTEALLPQLKKAAAASGPSSPAHLVFVSSIMGSLELATRKDMMWYPHDNKAYDSSKAAMNMLMLNYDRILAGDNVLVNAVCPGLVTTKLSAYAAAGATPEVGAKRIVELATLGAGGPSGTFSNQEGPIPW